MNKIRYPMIKLILPHIRQAVESFTAAQDLAGEHIRLHLFAELQKDLQNNEEDSASGLRSRVTFYMFFSKTFCADTDFKRSLVRQLAAIFAKFNIIRNPRYSVPGHMHTHVKHANGTASQTDTPADPDFTTPTTPFSTVDKPSQAPPHSATAPKNTNNTEIKPSLHISTVTLTAPNDSIKLSPNGDNNPTTPGTTPGTKDGTEQIGDDRTVGHIITSPSRVNNVTYPDVYAPTNASSTPHHAVDSITHQAYANVTGAHNDIAPYCTEVLPLQSDPPPLLYQTNNIRLVVWYIVQFLHKPHLVQTPSIHPFHPNKTSPIHPISLKSIRLIQTFLFINCYIIQCL